MNRYVTVEITAADHTSNASESESDIGNSFFFSQQNIRIASLDSRIEKLCFPEA